MSSKKQKLRLMGAFAALATLALAVSCKGFFVNPTLTSIAISPTAPQVAVGTTAAMQVFGTFDDGSRSQVTTGVSWSTSDNTIATVDPTGGTLTGVAVGTATITADAQGLSSTATATVFLSGVSAIQVNPSSGTVSITSGSAASFTALATANGTQVDITGSASWTLNPTSTTVTCTFSLTELCSATDGVGTYTLTASYPGTSVVGTATLIVNP